MLKKGTSLTSHDHARLKADVLVDIKGFNERLAQLDKKIKQSSKDRRRFSRLARINGGLK